MVVDVLGLVIILPLLPIYAQSLGATPFKAGLLISVYGLCQLIAGPILGRISDRVGRKPVLLVSQVGTLIGFFILAYSKTLGIVFLSRVIDGLTAGNISVAQAYIADVTSPKDRARSFAVIGIAFGLAFLVGPAISGFLVRYGYKVPILAAAALSATSILATFFLLPSRAALPSAVDAPTGPVAPQRPMIRVLADAVRQPRLGPLLWQFFAFTFAFSLFISGFPLFAERRLSHGGIPYDVQHIGYVLAFMGLVGMIFQGGFFGRFVTRFGEGRLVIAGFAIMALSHASLGFVHSTGPVLAVIAGLGIGTSLVRPSLTSLVTQIVARNEQGMAIGMTQAIMSVSQIVAPMVGGALIGHGHLAVWAGLAAVVCLPGLFLAFSGAPTDARFVA